MLVTNYDIHDFHQHLADDEYYNELIGVLGNDSVYLLDVKKIARS
jgi:hypothetical protein